MHKKNSTRLLAMVLSIMMILSLVVVPAGAARPMGGADVAEAPAGEDAGAHLSAVSRPAVKEAPAAELLAGDGKIDVWDFGAEQLDATKFNNKLTVDVINAWFPGVAAGTSNQTIANFDSTQGNGVAFSGGGATNHRLRSTNTALTRYDNKSLAGAKGTDPYFPDAAEAITYTGYIYSNAASSSAVYLALDVNAGDIVTFLAGSNSGVATYAFTSPSGQVVNGEYTKTAKVEPMTFYPSETGTYKLHCTNEKLVVARVYRKPATEVAVTGAVTAPADIPAGYQIVFTDLDNQSTVEAAVTDGSYSATLFQGHRYAVSLKGADEYVISSEKSLDLTAETGTAKTLAVTIQGVPMSAVEVTVSGVTTTPAVSAKLVLVPKGDDAIYNPTPLAVANGTTSVKLEKDREYTAQLVNANDYVVGTTAPSPVKFTEDTGTLTIPLEPKPTHAVTIAPEGLTLDDLADATFTFTNIEETYEGEDGKEAPYTYTFTGPSAIALRNGQYKVKVNTTKGIQKLTPDVKVNNAAVERSIGFETNLTVDAGTYALNKKDEATNHFIKGVTWGAGAAHNNDHGPYNFTTMKLNLASPATVTVTTCCYGNGTSLTATGNGTVTVADGTEVNDKVDPPVSAKVFTITGIEAGEQTLTFESKVYIHNLKVEYAKDAEVTEDVTVTVGTGKDYETINAALDYIETLNRAANVRAILVIDPGNYEEQVQVNVPNVTFKNAKAADATLELKNKGVDIGDNEVRITWYYGQFHDYYSMAANDQFDADTLAVNQENGYLSYNNRGGKIDNQSYWNSTVSLNADGFAAEGIIFENSYNQYMSAAAVRDTIVPKGSSADRESLEVGSTEVQKKNHVGQAAAIGLGNNIGKASFDHCAFIGRQDVVFGGVGTKMAFYDCDLYGACDYIMGDMNALFVKCDLVMNTDNTTSTDVAYISAASQQQTSQRGFLFWNCTVRSAVPNVETASTVDSKPGTLGRAWKAAAEAVFYETVVGTTTTKADGTTGEAVSLIQPEGWTVGLGGNFTRCAEYRTHEAEGSTRVPLSDQKEGQPSVLTAPVLADGTAIDPATWLGGWQPFEGKDMTVDCPGGHVPTSVTITGPEDATASEVTSGETAVTVQLTAAVAPATADQLVNWTSSSETVTVDKNGLVTVPANAAEEEVTITATAAAKGEGDVDVKGTYVITVKANTPDVPVDPSGAIVILHSNDVHGAVDTVSGKDDNGKDITIHQNGYAKMAQLKADYEAKGATVYVMDAGDFSQGTTYVSVSQGATAIELMNLVGYDLATTGNHEFDYGAANLDALAAKADFDFLAANIMKDGANAYTKSVMLEAGDKKIGVFGLATPETATKAHPAKIKGLTFLAGQELFTCAQTEVDALKAAGADYIICLGHLGIDAESTGNRSIDLLTAVNGIDVFIDGHSHSTLDQIVAATNAERTVNGAQLTSTGTKFANIGVVTIAADGTITTENVPTASIELDETNTKVKAVMDKAAAIEAEIDADYNAKFATSAVDLNGARDPGNRTEETNLGDLITDAMLWLATKDDLGVPTENVIALTNGGGIRASIAKGDVTKNDILTVLPFGNTVAVDYVKGSVLLEALEASTYCTPTAVGAFPQVAGIEFTVDTTKAFATTGKYPGSTYDKPDSINRVTITSVNGKAFDPEAEYAIVTNDFVAAGGDTYYALSVSEKITDTGVPLDECLMQYITTVLKGSIGEDYAEPQGRITIITADNIAQLLDDAITEAKALAADTQVSKDGKDVRKTEMWVTSEVKEVFETAIQDAINAKTADAPTADDLITALKALQAATGIFDGQRAPGTKRGSSASSGNGGVNATVPTTVTTTNDNGDVATITTQPGGDKTITVVNKDGETVAQVKLPATIPAAKTKFKDVPDSFWAAREINDMAGLGMVKGVNEEGDVFDTQSSMTRASVATMFFRLANGKPGLESAFADMQGHWGADAVAWAAKTGVVNGYSAEAFGPDDVITRQQLAVMLCRFANLVGLDTKAHTSALDVFADADQADTWAVDSLAWCVKNGVMKGRGGDILDPKTDITRAEAAAMFDRVINLMK